MKDPDEYRRQARVLKALANSARLQIIDRLAHSECSVGELARLVGLDQSTVSKHLSVLRNHGIVSDQREGNMVFYRLLTPCVLDFFACADKVLGGH
jgi:DNA-binding transcriptional ArsR family regulator